MASPRNTLGPSIVRLDCAVRVPASPRGSIIPAVELSHDGSLCRGKGFPPLTSIGCDDTNSYNDLRTAGAFCLSVAARI
ncbi:uncharacterized protein ARMOST_02056 [Armillaria ostoyae]|uniref:Uncharacterized protein n=1 Tax=Armillaria ostoyae TaxID=47428 RepID=A0A284QQP9_ARMOS|nr:uncharacterized protein ARMOST_02056 [Armillaria ostoyae]